MIPRSSLSYVLARRRPPTHLLGCPRWASPRHWRCARTQRHARAVPGTGFMRLSGGGKVYPGWRLGFRQSSFSHIARVPSARRPYASARPLVSWHALVPFTFQIQVSHQTQEYPPNPSRLSREYDRAPRGADTGRPPARCPWFGSFSGGPRSEPDWHLSVHPALQRLSRAVRGWLPPAACTQDSRRRFGVLHYAYLPASGILQPPGPLRPAGGFPALPGGALLPRLLRGLCHRGTRVR